MDGITLYYPWEVYLMELIQQYMNEFTILFFSIITYFGEEAVTVLVLGYLYWCFNKDFAKKVGIYVIIGIVLNPLLKNIVLRRRPYMDNPSIQCFKPIESGKDIMDVQAQGYSFPSGHSMNAVCLYGSIARELRKKKFVIIAIVLCLLVGFSRVALGVHYPTDVLVGWLCGLILLFSLPYIQKWFKNKYMFYLVLVILFSVGFFYCTSNDYYTCYGIMLGYFISDYFEEKYVNFEPTKVYWKQALRLIGGILIFFGGNALLKLPFSSEFLSSGTTISFLVRTIRYMIVIFLMMGVYPMIFGKFDKKEN